MPIYSIQEKVKYFKDVINFQNGVYVSLPSGNVFESLATSNPELFNIQKLKQLEFSRDLVMDFNRYFNEIGVIENNKLSALNNDAKDMTEEEYIAKYGEGYFAKNFNILYHSTFFNDLAYLTQELGGDRAKAIAIIINNYFPESLSEEGVKALIRVRLINHKILVDGLTRMLKSNYELLDMQTAEAKVMLDKLHDDSKSHEAIGDIKTKMLDPKTINKFKDGNNYDFRSIGGAYVVLGKHIDFEGANPAKYLVNLFKYDCIIISHGSYYPKERTRSILRAVLTRGENVVARFIKLFNAMMNDEEFTKVLNDKYSKKLIDKYNEVNKYTKRMLSSDETKEANEKMLELIDILIDIINDDSIPWYDKEEVFRYASTFDYIMQSLQAKYNIIQNKIDGKSSEWVIRPVSTLKQKNLTHMIDILRALKAEGFKNIGVFSCNPGNVKLPLDLRASLNFTVTMGHHSVFIEDTILQEGIIDSFKDGMKKIKNALAETKNACTKFFNDLKKKASDLISNRFKKYKKFDKPVKINLISIDKKNGGTFEEVLCSDPEDLKKRVEFANKSIMDIIDRLNEDQRKYLEKVKEPNTIFEGIEFI